MSLSGKFYKLSKVSIKIVVRFRTQNQVQTRALFLKKHEVLFDSKEYFAIYSKPFKINKKMIPRLLNTQKVW